MKDSSILQIALDSDEYCYMSEFNSDEFNKCWSDVVKALNDDTLVNRFDESISHEIANIKSCAFIMGFKKAFCIANEVFS